MKDTKGKRHYKRHTFDRITALVLSVLLVAGSINLNDISAHADSPNTAAQQESTKQVGGGGAGSTASTTKDSVTTTSGSNKSAGSDSVTANASGQSAAAKNSETTATTPSSQDAKDTTPTTSSDKTNTEKKSNITTNSNTNQTEPSHEGDTYQEDINKKQQSGNNNETTESTSSSEPESSSKNQETAEGTTTEATTEASSESESETTAAETTEAETVVSPRKLTEVEETELKSLIADLKEDIKTLKQYETYTTKAAELQSQANESEDEDEIAEIYAEISEISEEMYTLDDALAAIPSRYNRYLELIKYVEEDNTELRLMDEEAAYIANFFGIASNEENLMTATTTFTKSAAWTLSNASSGSGFTITNNTDGKSDTADTLTKAFSTIIQNSYNTVTIALNINNTGDAPVLPIDTNGKKISFTGTYISTKSTEPYFEIGYIGSATINNSATVILNNSNLYDRHKITNGGYYNGNVVFNNTGKVTVNCIGLYPGDELNVTSGYISSKLGIEFESDSDGNKGGKVNINTTSIATDSGIHCGTDTHYTDAYYGINGSEGATIEINGMLQAQNMQANASAVAIKAGGATIKLGTIVKACGLSSANGLNASIYYAQKSDIENHAIDATNADGFGEELTLAFDKSIITAGGTIKVLECSASKVATVLKNVKAITVDGTSGSLKDVTDKYPCELFQGTGSDSNNIYLRTSKITNTGNITSATIINATDGTISITLYIRLRQQIQQPVQRQRLSIT